MEENKIQVMSQEIKVETTREFIEPKWMKILKKLIEEEKIILTNTSVIKC